MKAAGVLLAALASTASGAWLKWTANTESSWYPATETGGIAHDLSEGWTPKPTAVPGIKGEADVVLELLRRDDTTTNWTNSQTCGWVSGTSSFPWTCGSGFTCATNNEHAVACTSGDYEPFYVSCFDFEASKAGSCDSVQSNTGCCESAASPACVTYLWTGTPVRSMFRCGTTTAVTSILDEPQFVIDASKSSESAALASSSAAEASKASEASNGGSDTTATPGSIITNPSNTSNTTNVGAIVGGVIGGILGLLLLLLLLWCCCCRRRRNKKNNYNLSYKNNHSEKNKVYSSRRGKRVDQRSKKYGDVRSNVRSGGKKSRSRSKSRRHRRDDDEAAAYMPTHVHNYTVNAPESRSHSDDDHATYLPTHARNMRSRSRSRSSSSSRSRSRSRGHRDHRDDDMAYPHSQVHAYSTDVPDMPYMPNIPQDAHLSGHGTTIYAPQYHFHVSDHGKDSRDSSIERPRKA